MKAILSVQGLTKSFAARPLFKNLNFGIFENAKVCLVGPNGAGKSTLMKILAGLETADAGMVTKRSATKVAYLEQSPTFKDGQTLFECALEKAQHPDEWEAQSMAHEWISKCGFLDEGYTEYTVVNDLSGGWKKRAALMRELMKEPDLLLLDEPTNHLDLESVLWLEDLLEAAKFAFFAITHDRKFMQRIAGHVYDLDKRYPDGLLIVEGTFSDYLYTREIELGKQTRLEDRLKNVLRGEFAWLLKEPRARGTKSKSRINRTHDLMDNVDDLVERNRRQRSQISFVAAQGGTQKLIEAKKITKSYDGRVVLKDLDLLVTVKSRIGLLGRNGSGKSTLLKALLGRIEVDSGTIYRAEHLQVIYFSQEREKLDLSLTPRTTLCPQGEYVSFGGNFVHVNGYLERFLLGGDKAGTKVSKLSGGEQSRLLIAKLMLSEGNLLVLDEPTNDLDLDTLHVLEEALEQFSGGLILVTHDRLFLNRLCHEILYVNEATIERFADVIQWEDYYLEKRAGGTGTVGRVPAAATATAATIPVGAEPSSPAPAPKAKLSYKLQRELDGMEAEIQKYEAEVQSYNHQLLQDEVTRDSRKVSAISQFLAQSQKKVEELYARWQELNDMKG